MADANAIKTKIVAQRSRWGMAAAGASYDMNSMRIWTNELNSHVRNRSNGGYLCNCQCNSGATPTGGVFSASYPTSDAGHPIYMSTEDSRINAIVNCYSNCHGNCYANCVCHSNCNCNCNCEADIGKSNAN